VSENGRRRSAKNQCEHHPAKASNLLEIEELVAEVVANMYPRRNEIVVEEDLIIAVEVALRTLQIAEADMVVAGMKGVNKEVAKMAGDLDVVELLVAIEAVIDVVSVIAIVERREEDLEAEAGVGLANLLYHEYLLLLV
jgi:hypothetical protein